MTWDMPGRRPGHGTVRPRRTLASRFGRQPEAAPGPESRGSEQNRRYREGNALGIGPENGKDTDAAAEPLAPKALAAPAGPGRPWEGSESRMPESRWPRARGSVAGRETTSGARGRPGRVGSAKRLRRPRRRRWERASGTRARATREGVRPRAGCGREPHETGRLRGHGLGRQKADVFSMPASGGIVTRNVTVLSSRSEGP